MRRMAKSFALFLLALVVLPSARINAQIKASPERHEAAAAPPAGSIGQNNQAALYAALIEALHAATEQEKTTAQRARADNEALISPTHVQEGLLLVGFLYSLLAWMQWRVLSWASVAQHRPRVGLRQVTLLNDLEKDNVLLEPIEVGFFLVNRGSTPAWIVQGNVTLRFDSPNKLPAFNIPSMLPPYDADHAILKGTKLKPAIQRLFKKQITLDRGDPSAFHAIDPQRAGSKAFYVLGYFVYRDQIGRSYRTAFCRRYHPIKREFQALGDRDYEYED